MINTFNVGDIGGYQGGKLAAGVVCRKKKTWQCSEALESYTFSETQEMKKSYYKHAPIDSLKKKYKDVRHLDKY